MLITLSQNNREPRELSELLGEILKCAIIAVNRDGGIAAITPEGEALTGLSAGAAPGRPLNSLPPAIADEISAVFSTGTASDGKRLSWELPDGTRADVHACLVPVKSGGEVRQVIVSLANLSPAKKLEGTLLHLEKLASIGALSTNMAHEIRNALVAVKTFAELLVNQNRDAELAGLVGREMNRIDSIAAQVLTFSAPAPKPLGTVSLHELLEQSLQLIQHQVRDQNLRLSREFHAQPDTVRGNPAQLQQAFLNLLFNALEATERGGGITVETLRIQEKEGGARVRISISDSGAGIPPEDTGKLLEPFFTTKPSGTGLGLPITYQIVQEHGGMLLMETAPRLGTTFSIDLPAGE